MTVKQYTYDDWKEGKVVLETTRMEFNKNEFDAPLIVSWNQFDAENQQQIKAEQEATFERLKNEAIEKFKLDLDEQLNRVKDNYFLLNKYLNFYMELINDEMVVFNGFTKSAYLDVTFEERYYLEMQFYIEHFLLGSKVFDCSTVPSQKCKYYNHNRLLPEVYVEMIWEMLQHCKGLISFEIKNEDNSMLNEYQDRKTDVGLDEFNPRFFKNIDAYKFFLECKKDIPSRAKKSKKNNDSSPSEVAKYSVIFNFMKTKSLIFQDTNHQPFINYLRETHNVNIPESLKKFPYQPAESDLMLLKEKFKNWPKK